MSIQVEVSGPYALFSRPEMKTERVSYDCMTPSAARGLLESFSGTPVCAGSSTAFMSVRRFTSPTSAETR